MEQKHHVLIVDDDQELREQIGKFLCDHGFRVSLAQNAVEMDAVFALGNVNIVVLDVMMPGEDGLSICRRLAHDRGPPVIMLSAMGDQIDRIIGLELGAADYLAKPCHPRELLARLKVALRRNDERGHTDAQRGSILTFNGFTLDLLRRRLNAPNGTGIVLTGGEFALLSAFLQRPREILSREHLLSLAHDGAGADIVDRSVDVQVSRLRRKLEAVAADSADSAIISTYRGAGYLFNAHVSRGQA